MQAEQIRQQLELAEQCADEAMHAVKAGRVPDALRRSVEALHKQASDAKHHPLMNDALYRETIAQLEQLADEAMAACRDAGSVDPQVRDAVQRAHRELSRLSQEVGAQA